MGLKKKTPGKPEKSFEHYLIRGIDDLSDSVESFSKTPAVTFLNSLCNIHYAVENCRKYFNKKADGELNQDALRNLRIISISMLPTMMGQFETFQRVLFAQLFEYSRYLKEFNIDDFIKAMKKTANLEIDVKMLSAYRGMNAPVGLSIADSLNGWHNPERVNFYFRCIISDVNFYTNQQINALNVLWQLRHSIVHTGSWLTRADSQKHPALSKYAEHSIAFEDPFISAVAKKFHIIIKGAVGRMKTKYVKRIDSSTPSRAKGSISKMFTVKSKMGTTWL